MSRGYWIGRLLFAFACGAILAFVVLQLFGVSGQSDTRPPECTNAFGQVVACDSDPTARIMALGVLLGLPAMVLIIQIRRSRRGWFSYSEDGPPQR